MTAYQIDHALPDMVLKGSDSTIQLRLTEGADGLVVPSAASIAIYDDSNSLVGTVAGTISGSTGIVSAVVPAAYTSSKDPSDRWYTVWSITIAGAVLTHRSEAYICRYLPYCPIVQDDLLKRQADLMYHKPDTWVDYTPAIENAWISMQADLISLGNRPNLILDRWKLRKPLIALTLYNLYIYFQSRAADPAAWAEAIKTMHTEYVDAWKALSFKYDSADSGQDTDEQQAAWPVVYLGSRRGRFW